MSALIIYTLSLYSDFIGLCGAALALVMYFLLQIKKISSEHFLFSLLNAASSFLILTSLFYSWNLAAFVMESAWMFVSLYGAFAAIKKAPLQVNVRGGDAPRIHRWIENEGLFCLLQ